MPTFTPLEPFKIKLYDASFLPAGTNRPVGLHQSQIIRAKKAANGDKITGIEGEDPNLRAQWGFLWERAIDLVWQGVPWGIALEIVWREYLKVADLEVPKRGPVETQLHLEQDRILMTPDGLDHGNDVLESYKLTWKSMRKWEEDPEGYFWDWLDAEAGYIRTLRLQRSIPLECVRFFIFWANGDYSRKVGKGPQATFTDVCFSEEELERNWLSHLRWRDYIESQGGK